MAELETEDITCELIIKPALAIMEARFPVALVNIVNEYIDSVRDSAATWTSLFDKPSWY
jgi:hypothetical protein